MIRPRRLRSRMALFFGVLLGLVLGTAFAVVNGANRRAALAQVRDELDVGERVAQRVLAQNADKLAQAARVLAADFAFREAVASRDVGTVRSALVNHGARIHAADALFVGLAGQPPVAAHDDAPALPEDLAELLQDARRIGTAHRIDVADQRLYQDVVVPVRAPLTIGWVVVRFALDDSVAHDLGTLTGVDVSFAIAQARGWSVQASTLDVRAAAALRDRLPPLAVLRGARELDMPDGTQQIRVLELGGSPASRAVAILQRPLAGALARFAAARSLLAALAAASLIVAILGCLAIARGITRPLDRLVGSVQRLRAGDYAVPIAAEDDDEVGALATGLAQMRDDVAERERRIRRLAYEDTLTGLPNRARFADLLAERISACESAAQPTACSVLLLDLDRFRTVNDTLGHDAGDQLLRDVAGRVRAAAKPPAAVARLGGDEFAILLPHDLDAEDTAAVDCARRVLKALEAPVRYLDQPVDVRASIGIAAYPRHGADAATLLRHADVAMYVAKRARAGHAVYDLARDTSKQAHLSLLGELKRAIERDELEVHYQPKISLADPDMLAAEALLRWNHPERGRVSPAEFIPFAEQTGYIRHVTRWLIARVLAQCGAWHGQGLAVHVALNLSTRDLADHGLPDYVELHLQRNAVPPSSLCVEITESGFMEDPEHALAIMERLAALGIRLAIDDYGTGYSSLTYLMRLPIDELKIDRSFIGTLAHDAALATIVRSTIELGHSLGLEAVAEGVEDPESLRLLQTMGCDAAQGYLISAPLPVAEFEHWLRAPSRADAAPRVQPSDAGRADFAHSRRSHVQRR